MYFDASKRSKTVHFNCLQMQHRAFSAPFFPCPDLDLSSDLLDPLHYSDQNEKEKHKEKLLKYSYTPLFVVWC